MKPITLLRKLACGSLLLAFAVLTAPASAAPTTYGSRTDLLGALGLTVTDDYSNPGYSSSSSFTVLSDAQMSAVLGETDYTSTGFVDTNIVFSQTYCAGCNGSFRLSFTTTTVGGTDGVYGVGFDYNNVPTFGESAPAPYVAFVTFGDNSTAEYTLSTSDFFSSPLTPFFFGITAPELIRSIHLGLAGGGATQIGGFALDNLVIGSVANAVPEPSTLMLLALGLLAMLGARRRSRA